MSKETNAAKYIFMQTFSSLAKNERFVRVTLPQCVQYYLFRIRKSSNNDRPTSVFSEL